MAYDLSRLQPMIVEADEAMQATWRGLLAGFGIRRALLLRGSREAWTALSSADAARPDLLICRWELPGGDSGLDLVARLRQDPESPAPFLPAIIVTGRITRERVARALAAGVHEILVLPLSAKALESRLREVVEKPRKFIRAPGYFGPDRRRQVRPDYAGPFRRKADRGG